MKYFVGLVIGLLLSLCIDAGAQEATLPVNAWGFYISPTTHRLSTAPSKYELYHTNTGEDFGLYYSRNIHRYLSVQIEGRYGIREADIEYSNQPARVRDAFLEIPVIFHVSRVRRVDKSYLRVFIGGGISYRILVEQEVVVPESGSLPPDFVTPINFGGYQKYGWVLDGGCAFMFTGRSGIFASYRVTQDQDIFSESEDLVVNPKYYSYGFQVGFEFRFGALGESPN